APSSTTSSSAPSATSAASAPSAATAAAAVATATPRPTETPTVPAPLSLAQKTAGGATLATAGWVGAAGVTAQVMAPPAYSEALRAEVEARPLGQSFAGTVTASAPVTGG